MGSSTTRILGRAPSTMAAPRISRLPHGLPRPTSHNSSKARLSQNLPARSATRACARSPTLLDNQDPSNPWLPHGLPGPSISQKLPARSATRACARSPTHLAEALIGEEAQRFNVPMIPIFETLWHAGLQCFHQGASKILRDKVWPETHQQRLRDQNGARRSTLSQCRSRAPLATFRVSGSSCTQEPRDSDKKNNVHVKKR